MDEFEHISVSHRIYDLIFALNAISPSLVEGSLPQMEYKLHSVEEKERRQAVTLLAKLFSDKDSKFCYTHTPLWRLFLGRFNDISVEIRKICLQHSMHFLLNHPSIRKDIEDCLCLRIHDCEEKVRLEVVKSVVSVSTAYPEGFEYIAGNKRLLDCVKERTMDKKGKIRHHALQGLADIYKIYLEMRIEGGPPAWIHNQILLGYYLENTEDRILIERLVNVCLVPCEMEAKDRMVQMLYLVSTADSNAYSAFLDIQRHLVL